MILETHASCVSDEAVADLALPAGASPSRRPKQMFRRTVSQGNSV
jgi:hypothetical protein